MGVGGVIVAVAPFLDWFRVTAVADGQTTTSSLAGTVYGTTTSALGILAVAVALSMFRRRPVWRWWPALVAGAMFLAMVTGIRGGMDPLGTGKAALSEEAAMELAGVEPGLVEDLGFRIRLAFEFNQDRLLADSLVGGWVAAAGGAIGLVGSVPLVVRAARGRDR
jgi:hypothetical protein